MKFNDILWCDTETYNETPLAMGTHRYAETVEVTVFSYALNDEPAEVWDVTSGCPMPAVLAKHLHCPTTQLRFHNVGFDYQMLKHGMKLDIPVQRFFCTMAQAYAHSLPGSLDVLSTVMGLPEGTAKQKDGKALVMLFCKPRPKGSALRRATRHTHPEEWARFLEYARVDVEAMRAVAKKMPMWNMREAELDLWHLDQTINNRGLCIDVALAKAAMEAADLEKAELKRKGQEHTAGAVSSLTKRDELLKHLLAEYGVDLPDLKAATLERRIGDPALPEALKELLRMRLQATTTSTAKYKTLVNGVSSDGQLRGTLQFAGASRTARWAGRLFQPQNLPRPSLKQKAIVEAIEAVKAGVLDLVADDVMRALSSAVRGSIIAPPGCKLVVADLANIEGRKLAWLAGEEWKLQAFRDFDTVIGWTTNKKGEPEPIRKGADLYAIAYAKSFGVTPDVVMENKESGDGNMRQVGKVMELALGYEGGVGAFLTFAAVYNIDLEAMAESAKANIDPRIWAEAEGMYQWTLRKKRSTFGLSKDAWLVCESFKRLWREAHPNITAWWKELDTAVRDAIAVPGVTIECRKVRIRKDGTWLRIGLPSGRSLSYPGAKIDDKGRISYMGVNQYSRQWQRLHTYGGKLAENITQAAARDVLAEGMKRAEAAGYPIVTTIHDELLTAPADSPAFTAGGLGALMSEGMPAWANGLPLAAAGFEDYRYRKD